MREKAKNNSFTMLLSLHLSLKVFPEPITTFNFYNFQCPIAFALHQIKELSYKVSVSFYQNRHGMKFTAVLCNNVDISEGKTFDFPSHFKERNSNIRSAATEFN
jgi:hypothetical protein